MKPLNLVIMSAVLAIAGTWAETKTVSTKQVVGGAVVALVFAGLQDAQPELAKSLGWLILVATASAYGEQLFTNIGTVVSDGKKAVQGKPLNDPTKPQGRTGVGSPNRAS